MKSIERHKLKENEFARSVAHAKDAIQGRGSDVVKIVGALAIVVALVGGFFWWRSARESKANGVLATALATYERPVVPPQPAAPGSPPPLPQPGTFQSEKERLDAALPQFMAAASAHPNSAAATTARFHAASILASLGRHSEAEEQFKAVVDKAGNTIYGRTARLGMADAQIAQRKFDNAIAIYTEVSRDPNSTIPVDAVLMQLGRAYVLAGKKDEALSAFNRIVNEFPQSPYVADARKEIEATKRS
jgi:TolA-binding protein